ncbi:kinase [Plantactinospora sp. ZYX-F-223]|uniref:kinase n=1 Tax=Plantactinospora sp. ZYX-F-223 TaxID=3144103 RepID=UPI0031FCC82E
MTRGIILYGPPAAGKDTITRHLEALHNRYVLFPRLKAGRGRTTGYRITTLADIEALRRQDGIIWENHRYGATYVLDRPGLTARLAEHVPVLHLGQVEGVHAVTTAIPDTRWVIVHVWCPRGVAEIRIRERGTGDTAERLKAWDETKPITDMADLTINTLVTSPGDAARQIDSYVNTVG